MKLFIERSVAVILPTIGSPYLGKAVASVLNQTYKNLTLYIVVDGLSHLEKFSQIKLPEYDERIKITILPDNTGANNFYGHRIYAGFSHLVNHDYICFLDEDNFYDENHVKSLVSLLDKEPKLDFAYSLRNICAPDGKFLYQDNCESTGYPIFWSLGQDRTPEYLVDTSAYCFNRQFLIRYASLWHEGWGADRKFYSTIRSIANHKTTGEHTLNYRLDNNMKAKYGSETFFIDGNETIKNYYGGEYPWKKQTM